MQKRVGRVANGEHRYLKVRMLGEHVSINDKGAYVW